MASISVANELTSTMERQTKDGRTLLYQMEVIQQPERARACGAGAKSSADRRPVDPPPIVDLRIFELHGDEKRDITFPHEANFFLYSTLEHARPMNQGRVPVTAATLPVLTGTPVAGMAYLDRPKPAGYFIFPDLSVRHEGKYRLSFNLYEELKNPEKDGDPDAPSSANPQDSTKPKQHVHFRLEVKSNPFNVFSAKKFPGLAESTSLSRIVNEQGCRVRIRRDVRMRRRDKVSDSYRDTDELAMPQTRYPMHTSAMDRPRSPSNVGSEASTPYSAGPEKRGSFQDLSNYYPSTNFQQPQPQVPQSASSYTSHLSFGGSATPHYQTPSMISHPQPQVNQSYATQAQSYPYPSHGHSHNRQLSGPQAYGYSNHQNHAATYNTPSFVDDRMYPDSRRSSAGYPTTRTQGLNEPYDHSRASVQQNLGINEARSLTPLNTATTLGQGPTSLPPIKALVHQSPLEPRSSETKQSSSSIVPHGPHNPFSAAGYAPAYQSQPPTSSQHSAPSSASQPKRTYSDVFDASHMNHPLHSGMRPTAAAQSQDLPQIETADGDFTDPYNSYSDMTPLIYKRADGSRRAKKCPSPRDSSRGYART